jgi:hypothetical protein
LIVVIVVRVQLWVPMATIVGTIGGFSSLLEQPLIVDLVGVDVETVMGVVGQFKCLCFYF